ncbi:MAG: hypothetical protein A2167_00030 [Planctomycetes bacterium RBG_13_46_10]|nr:MAG: hypothetical protein A2167_00030 [Planctomycetes bacterium RBG_13_46_10]
MVLNMVKKLMRNGVAYEGFGAIIDHARINFDYRSISRTQKARGAKVIDAGIIGDDTEIGIQKIVCIIYKNIVAV